MEVGPASISGEPIVFAPSIHVEVHGAVLPVCPLLPPATLVSPPGGNGTPFECEERTSENADLACPTLCSAALLTRLVRETVRGKSKVHTTEAASHD